MNLEKSPDGLNITNSTGSGKAEALNDGLHRMSEAGLELHVIDVAEELAARAKVLSLTSSWDARL